MSRARLVLCLSALLVGLAVGQAVKAPDYEECLLAAVFPAGGQQGESVVVELLCGNKGNVSDARELVVDGPPGIAVRDLKNLAANRVQATFAIAKDAAPGRRCVRIRSERSGLTNMLYFTVGRLPEVMEKEPNNDLASAQAVTLPVVVNGRVNPQADVDCFRFRLKKGQRLAAAVLAHAIDSHGQGKTYGIVDASLQLLDERGRVVAEAGDTLGLDPQLEYVAPADGDYFARVFLEAYEGFQQAVYRLVLGEVALATSVFPPGGQRGTVVEVELEGPNVKPGTRQKVAVGKDAFPLQFVVPEGKQAADLELPFLRGDLPERLEKEPNQKPEQATPLDVPMTVNGRIDAPGDVDWYRLKLKAGQSVRLETTAQRFLRSPIDTLLEVHDSAGNKLAENDDGFTLDYVSMHDYRTMDSRLVFTPKADGDYFVRVSDQAGAGGPRAVYRLAVTEARPDFELYLFPDGVPVWGPGSTAALLVKVVRFDGLDGDVALTVEGLPKGWAASEAVSRGTASKPAQTPVLYQLLTITAPADAKPGDVARFRVVGRAKEKGGTLERTALPLTLYYTSDTGFFRITPQARAVVTRSQGPWLSSSARSLSAKVGTTVDIPVEVHGGDKPGKIDLTANLASSGVATAMMAPLTVPVKDGKAVLPLTLGGKLKPGRYGITVSLRWRADVRIGMPGPCTALIALEVAPPRPGPRGEDGAGATGPAPWRRPPWAIQATARRPARPIIRQGEEGFGDPGAAGLGLVLLLLQGLHPLLAG